MNDAERYYHFAGPTPRTDAEMQAHWRRLDTDAGYRRDWNAIIDAEEAWMAKHDPLPRIDRCTCPADPRAY